MSNNNKNKVKFGLKNVHVAKMTVGTDAQGNETYSYANPKAWPGAVSLSMDAQGGLTPFYADNKKYFVTYSHTGYEGDLESALVPDWVNEDIFGDTVDANGKPNMKPKTEVDANGNMVQSYDKYGNLIFEPSSEDDIIPNDTGDGANAVLVATLFNMDMTKSPKYNVADSAAANEAKRAIGTVSLNSFYNKTMTKLGADSESTDSKIVAQDQIMAQVTEWRERTAGVNWNEELTNMIMFQQGFSACSRCLTTMDEMLDRLINSTGMVGR